MNDVPLETPIGIPDPSMPDPAMVGTPDPTPPDGDTQSPIRILVVSDDRRFTRRLLEHLRESSYKTTATDEAETAVENLLGGVGYDAAVLNDALPGKSGIELLREMQRLPVDSSFLVVDNDASDANRQEAFELGAVDYVHRPIDMEELDARIEATLDRRLAPDSPVSHAVAVDGLTVNFASNTCFRDGERVPLTPLEFSILECFIENQNQIVSREELRETVWGDRDAVSLRTVDRHVAKIRDKLEPDADVPTYVQTVQGRGYEFAAKTGRPASA